MPLFRRPFHALDEPLILYSKPDCSLCELAEREATRVFGRDNVKVVDIRGQRALEDEYIFRIPVLTYRGQTLAEGLIGRAEADAARRRLRAALAAGSARR